jgi:hypothetical protein
MRRRVPPNANRMATSARRTGPTGDRGFAQPISNRNAGPQQDVERPMQARRGVLYGEGYTAVVIARSIADPLLKPFGDAPPSPFATSAARRRVSSSPSPAIGADRRPAASEQAGERNPNFGLAIHAFPGGRQMQLWRQTPITVYAVPASVMDLEALGSP